MVATVRILDLIARPEGKDSLHDPLVADIATKLVAEFEARLSDRQCVRWPEPLEMVRSYYARTARGPIVKIQPDGGECTTHWLNGKLHRNPKEGPAWHYVRGEEVRIEYGINGQLHRDPADGPALSYTHFEGREISGEEYFEHGEWHRPPSQGPAVIQANRSGRLVLEIYVEHGQRHRDPKQGPAWRAVQHGYERWEYTVRGKCHRDEEFGPAVIDKDDSTGIVTCEEYYRDGQLHRADGPATISRYPDGTLCAQAWYRQGKLHRDLQEGPAMIMWNEDGSVSVEDFWREGELMESRVAGLVEEERCA
jgi:hypothetical protein